MITRYFIKLAYKGTAYHGWQVQPNAMTVQEILTQKLSLLLGEEIKLTGCGRTDAGVHAKVFYAHFDVVKAASIRDSHLLFKLNGMLPSDITVYDIMPVIPDAHARFQAVSRTYEYHIMRVKDVFHHEFAHYIYGDINTGAMQRGADVLKEYSDFTSFSKVDTDVKTNNCRITSAYWEITHRQMDFTITADRFLRNMVRAIVGTLLDLGFNKMGLDDFRRIIELKNRSEAGTSVPAKGLFLTDVQYPPQIFQVWTHLPNHLF